MNCFESFKYLIFHKPVVSLVFSVQMVNNEQSFVNDHPK